MSNAQLFKVAERTVLEPGTTADQKLGALAFFESVGTRESADVIRQVMEMTGLYVSPSQKFHPALPMAGEVAGFAARGLGRLEEVGGLEYLTKIILSPTENQTLRECAAYGLGGLTSRESFLAFESVLTVSDPVVFARILKSIEDSFVRLESLAAPHVQHLLVALFNRAVDSLTRSEDTSALETIVGIIGKYLSPRGESELATLVVSSPLVAERQIAVGALLLRDSTLVCVALAEALKDRAMPPDLIDKIGNKLLASTEPTIISIAQTLLAPAPWWKRALSFIIPAQRKKRRARLNAALRILGRLSSNT